MRVFCTVGGFHNRHHETGTDGESNPFARYTPRARNAVVTAHNLAIAESISHVTAVLLARGVVAESESLGVTALRGLSVDIDAVTRQLVASTVSPGGVAGATAFVPYHDAAKTVLENTLDVAIRLGHNYVGTEHILIALFGDESASAALTASGVTADTFEQSVIDQLREQFPDQASTTVTDR